MNNLQENNNRVFISGEILTEAEFSHEVYGEGFYEIVPKGYSKATGIQFLCDYFKVGKEDCYAFGDSNNDLPMLQHAKRSWAIGNKSPQLTSLATDFAETADMALEEITNNILI